MFDIPKTATDLHRFAEVHQGALQNAALAVGGRRGLRLAQDLLEDLHVGGPITRRMQCKSFALLELLTMTKGREAVPPVGRDHQFCDSVSIHAHEITMLKNVFANALSKLKADGCVDSNGGHEEAKYD